MCDFNPDEKVTLLQKSGVAEQPIQRTLTLQEAVHLVATAPLGSVERMSSIIMRESGLPIQDLAEIDDINKLLSARTA